MASEGDALDFVSAIGIAEVARRNPDLRVEKIAYEYTDDAGDEHWSVEVRPLKDVTYPRTTIRTDQDWRLMMALNCRHEQIILRATKDGDYGGYAECFDCGRRIGGPDRQGVSDPGYRNRIAQMLVELRGAMHRDEMEGKPQHGG